jgi:hypothetical protein
MSIAVDVADIPQAATRQIGWCYLLTTNDAGQTRILAIAPAWSDGACTAQLGRTTTANVAARPSVTLLYPPAEPAAMSLIVDGDATMDGDVMTFRPRSGVMHRSAI